MEFTIQYISILIEALIAILGIMIFSRNKRLYGLGFFVTFGIYVFYDLTKLLNWNISNSILYILFFVASATALLAVWRVYRLR